MIAAVPPVNSACILDRVIVQTNVVENVVAPEVLDAPYSLAEGTYDLHGGATTESSTPARTAGAVGARSQMFILECFGFKDLPTLTHEMLGDRGTQTAAAPPTEERQAEVARKNILQFGRVHQKLIELAGPRTIDHDPMKK
jgi:hypothetical protein